MVEWKSQGYMGTYNLVNEFHSGLLRSSPSPVKDGSSAMTAQLQPIVDDTRLVLLSLHRQVCTGRLVGGRAPPD